MRYLFALLLAVTLAGCTPEATADNISKVQAAAAKACGFVPLASTVAAIIAASTGAGAAVVPLTTIATQICSAVTKRPIQTAQGDAPKPEVNGVVVEGYWIKSTEEKTQ